MKKEILLRSFKIVKVSQERGGKLVQDFPGAGNNLKSLDAESSKVFDTSNIATLKIIGPRMDP